MGSSERVMFKGSSERVVFKGSSERVVFEGSSEMVVSETLYQGDDALSTKPVMHYQGTAYLCY